MNVERASVLSRCLLVAISVACQPTGGSEPTVQADPLERLIEPAASWRFDDCKVDEAWVYAPSGTAGADAWTNMTPEPVEGGGCVARLDFKEDGASVAIDPSGVAGDGYGLSVRARFPHCGDGQTCIWTASLASRETEAFDSEKIWKYEVRVVSSKGATNVRALGYRESSWGGDDLEKVTVSAPTGLVSAETWTTFAIVVDRLGGSLSLWVDGQKVGTTAFEQKTFETIDRFAFRGEAWIPSADSTEDEVTFGQYVPSYVVVDEASLYALGAAQLEKLSATY